MSSVNNPVRLVDLREDALSADEILAAVADPAAGGINFFLGAVRDHDKGLDVGRLEYSAHPTALSVMTEVLEEVAAEFDVIAVAATHRIGPLAIGDAAVMVAASAAHRGVSYDASRAIIDRIKDRTPIWKHQHFGDGTEEWVNSP